MSEAYCRIGIHVWSRDGEEFRCRRCGAKAILYLKSLLVDFGYRVDLGALEDPERVWNLLAG
jgi:hypothetical protein